MRACRGRTPEEHRGPGDRRSGGLETARGRPGQSCLYRVHRQAIAVLIEFFQCRPKPWLAISTPTMPRHDGRTAGSEWGGATHFRPAPSRPRGRLHGVHSLRDRFSFLLGGTVAATDGTVWGGEVLSVLRRPLLARRAPCARSPFPGEIVPGANPAFRRRLVVRILGPEAAELARSCFARWNYPTFSPLLKRRVNSPRTSSMGRCSTPLPGLCGLAPVISFEGEAAMELEFASIRMRGGLSASRGGRARGIDCRLGALVRAVLEDRNQEVGVERISARFHIAIVDWTANVSERIGCADVVLSGGCFRTPYWQRG